jgi:CRP/FNR family transcriptional regulator, cyclic AMP receptor protein
MLEDHVNMASSKETSRLAGVRKLLLPVRERAEHLDTRSAPLRALFGPIPKSASVESGADVLGFLRRVYLFEDLKQGDLVRLARIVHERRYQDGEWISEQAKPGAALFVLRSGTVEITRRTRDGGEIPLATLEPPASFDELAAVGEVARWYSVRARGPVCLVALGASDLDALSDNFPILANKILRKLARITAARLQMLIETHCIGAEDGEREP